MNSFSLVTASLIVAAGVIDDLRSRKFHNWLFLVCTALALVVSIGLSGWLWGLNHSVIGFMAGLIAFLPLAMARIVGAGDMKLMAAFGAIVGWSSVLDVAVFSLLWGLVFGVLQVIFRGEFKAMVKNVVAIVSRKERAGMSLHRMPFTIAILMGWLTLLTQNGVWK